MAESALTRIGWLLIGAALVASVGCGKGKDDGTKAKADDPLALSKPVEDTADPVRAQPAPSAPAPRASVAEKDHEVVADEGPSEPAADDKDDADEDDGAKAKPSKKKRSKSRKAPSRRRASSDDAEERGPSKGADHASELKLKRIQFAHGISKREPIEPEETFAASETDKLYAFIELLNPSKEKSKVVVTFIPPMGGATKVTLDVGEQPRWRTWALRKSPKAVGTWRVIVRDEAGRELGHRSFEVTE